MNEREVVRLVSCLPKPNKGMKDDFRIALGAWHDGLHCLDREESQVGCLRLRFPPPFFFFFFYMGISFAISPLSSFLWYYVYF